MSLASPRIDEPYDSLGGFHGLELDAAEIAMRTHVRVMGVIHLLLASGLVIAAIVVALVVVGGGLLSGDPKTSGITSRVALSITLLLLALATRSGCMSVAS